MIYLQHPIHGTKIASLEAEAEADEIQGWKRYTPQKPVSALETPAEYVNKMEIKRPSRPRRSTT